MRNPVKRAAAFLLAFVLCISLVPVTAPAADAATYVYNWGTRGTVATYLSQSAIDFYEDNGVTYEELVALSGGTQSSAPSSELYKKLQNLMKNAQTYQTSYNATKELFRYTDCQNGGGKISSFYSGTPIGPSWDGNWNREHTWPNSKGDAAGNGENDIMMLRPTATSENSSRGNKAYGESSGYYNPNSESGGKYDLRGDVSRIMLFTYTRWNCTGTMWGSSGVIQSLDLLLRWMEEDPVDTWELGRNDAVESITGTRNVFVDYPELAFQLFSTEIPSDMDTPSGKAAAGSHSIQAVSNNTAWGKVEVNGKNITATPSTGYYAKDYTVISGSASVTQKGNIFTVTASSDCKIQINFAARTSAQVDCFENELPVSSDTCYIGDSFTLPQHSGTVPAGSQFMGWVVGSLDQTETKPSAIYGAGDKVEVTGDTDYYALYSWVDETTGTGNLYSLYTGPLTEGDYIIYYKDTSAGAMRAAKKDTRLDFEQFDVTDDTIQSPSADIVWHIAPAGQYWTVYNESTGTYAASNGKDGQAALVSSVTDAAKWTAAGDEIYNFQNLGNTNAGKKAFLRKNGTFGFACYLETFQKGLTLYKAILGTAYYSTEAVDTSHTHAYDQQVATKAHLKTEATCTEKAVYYVSCLCGKNGTATFTSGNALGHDIGTVSAKEPTCTEPGWAAYESCSRCDYSTKVEKPALDHQIRQHPGKEPTETEKGWKPYEDCSRCDYTTYEAIPALGKVITGLPANTAVELGGTAYRSDAQGKIVVTGQVPMIAMTFTYATSATKDPNGVAAHQQYPASSKVWYLEYDKATEGYKATQVKELDSFLSYKGTSIRYSTDPNVKNGIRVITGVPKDKREGLMKGTLLTGALAGYKLVEYGTLIKRMTGANDKELVYGGKGVQSSYALRASKNEDRKFSTTAKEICYTGAFVGLAHDLCDDELLLRSYMILEKDGKQIIVYGGILQRNIGYVAYQNKDFKPNQGVADFIWGIIRAVYGDKVKA